MNFSPKTKLTLDLHINCKKHKAEIREALLESLLKRVTSAHLHFYNSNFRGDSQQIKEFLFSLKKSNSLTKLSLMFESSDHGIIQHSLESLLAVKSLKYSRIAFNEFRGNYFHLRDLLPFLRKVATHCHLEIILNDDETHPLGQIEYLEWWLFQWSLRKIKASHKICVMLNSLVEK